MWVAGAVTLVAAAIALVVAITVTIPPEEPSLIAQRVSGAYSLAFALAGLLILVRRPGNRIGWITLALAFSLAVDVIGTELLSTLRDELTTSVGLATYISGTIFALPLTTALMLLFPDGRLPSPRWRPLGWAIVVWPLLTLVTELLSRSIKTVGPTLVPNPTSGVGGPIGDVAEALLPAVSGALVVLLFLAVSAAVFRFGRSRGVERQQLKWFAYAAALTALAGLLVQVNLAFSAIAAGSVCFLAVAIAIAVVRYRLYDIDLLINRTVVYGATTATVAATFFGGIVALQAALRPLTSGSELAVAASTLVSFTLFQPIRRRIQTGLDRRFNRASYDAARTLDAFADRLRDEVDLGAVRSDLIEAVRATMAPTHASLWLRERPG